ncbi:MAG TPA: hypothetical protein VD998_02645 [Verrucomicrobiae bacterium]|nr:hypothetical protein [Verrucomicrobiae bacterium]
MEEQDSSKVENKPELIKDTEKLFYYLQNNLTQEAKNTIWQFLSLIKNNYPISNRKKEWNILLQNLQEVIYDFENDLSVNSEMKLYGLQHNSSDLESHEHHEREQ